MLGEGKDLFCQRRFQQGGLSMQISAQLFFFWGGDFFWDIILIHFGGRGVKFGMSSLGSRWPCPGTVREPWHICAWTSFSGHLHTWGFPRMRKTAASAVQKRMKNRLHVRKWADSLCQDLKAILCLFPACSYYTLSCKLPKFWSDPANENGRRSVPC